MKIPSFVRLSKPKSFVYHPRYGRTHSGEEKSLSASLHGNRRTLQSGFLRAKVRTKHQTSFKQAGFLSLSILLFIAMALGYLWYGVWIVVVLGGIFSFCAYLYARKQT